MTTTQFASSSDLTKKLWSDRMYYDSISDENLVGQMIKDGTLVLAKDLQKSAGDNVKYHFSSRLSAAGLIGDQAATGNEQNLVYYQDNVTINQLRMVIQIPNKGLSINAQRVSFNLNEDTYRVLKDWMTERMTVGVLNQLAGFTSTAFSYDGVAYTSSNYMQLTGMNACTAPSGTGRVFRPIVSGTELATDQAVNADTTATMTFSMIDRAVESAKINRPYIMPFDGLIQFKCYVHYKQFNQLIQDTTSPIQYREIMLAKLSSGKKDEELIGGTMQYNQTLIIATDKVPNGVHSSSGAVQTNVRRAVLVGRDAGCIALGQGFSINGKTTAGFAFAEDTQDVEQQKRIAAVSIFGIEKTVFNSIDNGVIVLPTYVSS